MPITNHNITNNWDIHISQEEHLDVVVFTTSIKNKKSIEKPKKLAVPYDSEEEKKDAES